MIVWIKTALAAIVCMMAILTIAACGAENKPEQIPPTITDSGWVGSMCSGQLFRISGQKFRMECNDGKTYYLTSYKYSITVKTDGVIK